MKEITLTVLALDEQAAAQVTNALTFELRGLADAGLIPDEDNEGWSFYTEEV